MLMNPPFSSWRRFSLSLFLGLSLAGLVPLGASSEPRVPSPDSYQGGEFLTAQRRSRLQFKILNIRPSRAREGAISRGACEAIDGAAILPLLPQTNRERLPEKQVEVELTLAARPTLFAYVSSSSDQAAELTVLNEKGDQIAYQKKFTIQGGPGILALSLAGPDAPLAIGQPYHWYLSLICNPKDRSADVLMDGWVRRIEGDPQLASQLAAATPRDRPALYAEYGIWTDTLASLAELLQAQPDDLELQRDWASLLESVGLNQASQPPIHFIRVE